MAAIMISGILFVPAIVGVTAALFSKQTDAFDM